MFRLHLSGIAAIARPTLLLWAVWDQRVGSSNLSTPTSKCRKTLVFLAYSITRNFPCERTVGANRLLWVCFCSFAMISSVARIGSSR